MSWLFSQALVEEYSEAICSDGEQSVPLSGNNTPQAFCAPDKMMGFSRLSRFGMTFKPLTDNRGEELLTLYLAAFPVLTLAQQEKAQELMEKPVECGEKWRGSFTKYDPSSSSWKTHQCSLLGDLDEFSETWPQWGLMRNGECWEQQTLVQTTKEIVSGLWRTPTVSMVNADRAIDPEYGQRKLLKGQTITLADQVKDQRMWPTPVTRDYKDTGTQESMTRALNKRDSPGLSLIVGAATGGKLNPTWVEWLMGWPLGWTDLKPLEMDKSLCAQQQHGNYSVKEFND